MKMKILKIYLKKNLLMHLKSIKLINKRMIMIIMKKYNNKIF